MRHEQPNGVGWRNAPREPLQCPALGTVAEGLCHKTIMMRRHFLIAAGWMLAVNAAFADNEFQLPRECSERQNVNPEKCVIRDGPPRAPWVHRTSFAIRTQYAAVPAVAVPQSPGQVVSPPARTATRR